MNKTKTHNTAYTGAYTSVIENIYNQMNFPQTFLIYFEKHLKRRIHRFNTILIFRLYCDIESNATFFWSTWRFIQKQSGLI